jgi:hypothetical protein
VCIFLVRFFGHLSENAIIFILKPWYSIPFIERSMFRFFQSFFIATGNLLMLAFLAAPLSAQSGYTSQEVSDTDGVPVLIKHLPEWASVRSNATITNNVADLRLVLGERPVFESLEFAPGTEAVTAPYAAGKLLVIEYATPQAATEADVKFQQITQSQPVVYRRIGNYGAFIFDASDSTAANALLDQIKYEKTVQWLGEDPFLIKKFERYVALTGRDVALSTVLFIGFVLLSAIVLGVIAGIVYFRFRENQRAGMTAFSDAGGLTRLNLDDLSEPIRLD